MPPSISTESAVSGPRPSLRTLARLAGVSVMTASRALRNRPRVSASTRARVLKLAVKIGYRPDPEVAKLMHHLRKRRKPVFQGLICALTNRPIDRPHHYTDEILRGARSRADALGYGFMFLRFTMTTREGGEYLRGVLRNKGVEGLLLLPMAAPIDLGGLLDWSEFSVVAATSSVAGPEVRRVTPHQHANALLLCRQLAGRRCRRIGLAIDADQDARVNHAFTSAVLWHSRLQPGAEVPPLIYEGTRPAGLAEWFRRHRPDAIITSDEHNSRLFARILGVSVRGAVRFASLDVDPASGFSGIDELPAEIGASAVSLLDSLLAHGEKGLPAHPATMMVHGQWCEGARKTR